MKFLKAAVKALVSILLIIIALLSFLFLYYKDNPVVSNTIDFDKNLPVLNINNESFHGEIFGNNNKRLIIVLHGGPGSDYRSLMPLKSLSDKYRVIFFDQRGSGLSKRYKESELSIDKTISDISYLINNYSDNKQAVLIGHSFGGFIASLYTSKFPQMVDSLVLIESAPLSDDAYRFIDNSILISQIPSMIKLGIRSFYIKSNDLYARQDFFMTEVMSYSIEGYWCNDIIPQSVKMWRFGTLAYTKYNSEYVTYFNNSNSELNFHKYQGKVLILYGSCSVKYGSKMQNLNKKIFNNPELIEISKSGHMPVSENPDDTINQIRHYL